jgi:very-short-patch-repair endonuclease
MDVDAVVEELASRQYGVVASWQMAALGIGRHARARRVRSGRWVPEASRVVRMRGAPFSPEQVLMVGCLDAGRDAVVSHEAAGWLWQLPGFTPAAIVVRRREVHAPQMLGTGHRPKLVLPHHRTVVRDIPCTTLPRTLIDLAAVIHPDRLERLVDGVVTKSPAMLPALHDTFGELAQRGRKGIASMRRILAARPPGTVVPASGLERRFEDILRHAGEAPLRRQVDVGGDTWLGRVDYVDDVHLFVVEIDSALHHTSVSDRRRDEARDAALLAAGYREVLRITDTDIWRRPWAVVEAVREARRRHRRAAA